jgi:pullulanase
MKRISWKKIACKAVIILGALGGASALIAADVSSVLPLSECNAQEFATVLYAAPEKIESRALWLSRSHIAWPGVLRAETNGVPTRFRLLYTEQGTFTFNIGQAAQGDFVSVMLEPDTTPLASAVATRFKWLAPGVRLALPSSAQASLAQILKSNAVLVEEDAAGQVQRFTRLQIAGALDDLYARAEAVNDLGVQIASRGHTASTHFALWAPTAQGVTLCRYPKAQASASHAEPMRLEASTGVWRSHLSTSARGEYYRYLVDVFVPGVGVVRNRVTDPYAISLNADSARAYVGTLADAALAPPGWLSPRRAARVRRNVDMTIYELHVRDFSMTDTAVRLAWRGKYLAFTDPQSRGLAHLKALQRAGLTDVHLLPVFDIASVPEQACVTPVVQGGPDDTLQQEIIAASADKDCYNWGYDPWHFTAPEGSYATHADDGPTRVREFRAMVQALNRAGLRVGMDVVYNHTSAAGQHPKSVLDRIVPGYYHRLNATGEIERSTCCENTATEHRMMGKLMIDSVITWATQYRIDSFRFDLMGHQPRAVMEALQARVNAAAGRPIQLIGEGWNFGEVADGARFVQASQLALNGSGIGTFSDRGRDALRGGGHGDSGDNMIKRQGFVNGLGYAPNALADPLASAQQLPASADLVRAGLAGSLRDFPLLTFRGISQPLRDVDYNGQAAGYVIDPNEVVNYVENHDNHTLFDLNLFRLPRETSMDDRVRVQLLALGVTALSQGVAYFHAGVDLLRSKSFDANSFDSGDWFNRIDWSGRTNYFGAGLPPLRDNAANRAQMEPLLRDRTLAPEPAHISFARRGFQDLLKIRSSSDMFRLESATEVRRRLRFANVGPNAAHTTLVGHLDGQGRAGARFAEIVYFINVDSKPASLTLPEERGKAYVLHPVHLAAGVADSRPRREARYAAASGLFTVPARAISVFVVPKNKLKTP